MALKPYFEKDGITLHQSDYLEVLPEFIDLLPHFTNHVKTHRLQDRVYTQSSMMPAKKDTPLEAVRSVSESRNRVSMLKRTAFRLVTLLARSQRKGMGTNRSPSQLVAPT